MTRPVLDHIVEQHAEETAFLWTLRDAATTAPHYKRHHLARLDERLEAHVDGLRVAGEAGWQIAVSQLERHWDKGELFSAALLALESGDMRRIEPLAAKLRATPEGRRGFVGAIAWCRPDGPASLVREWDRSPEACLRYLNLCACSVHRSDAGAGLAVGIEDEDPLVRARAVRLAGEINRVDLLQACLRHIDDNDADVAFWAAWSGVLLGDRVAALEVIDSFVSDADPRRWAALELAVRARQLEHGADFVRRLAKDPYQHRTVLTALGHLGDIATIPWILEQINEPNLARLAGASFTMISGAALDITNVERRTPVPEAMTSDDTLDDAIATDPDEHLSWPEPALVRQWWRSEGAQFTLGRRYLLGRPIEEQTCERVWREGTQPQRRAAAYEATLRFGKALANWRQRANQG
jgi:uncharacterized protein (TIGR02270 family)